jgi:rare lipoprotein A
MSYVVQSGDTISKVTDLLKISWKELRRANPDAVGRSSKNGNWFLKQGAVIEGKNAFESVLKESVQESVKRASKSTPSEKAVHPNTPLGKAASESTPQTDSSAWKSYTIKSGDTLWELATKKFHVNVSDLMEANNIKDPRKLQPGQKLQVPVPSYPEEQTVVASWYGEPYHNRPMANGAIYNMHGNTVAHRDLPFGTKMELENPETGQKVKAVVTDRGPFIEGRDLDISYGLAQKLSLVKQGVAPLVMRITN